MLAFLNRCRSLANIGPRFPTFSPTSSDLAFFLMLCCFQSRSSLFSMLFAEYVRIQSFLQIKRPRKSVGVLGPSDLKIFIRFGVIKGFLGLKVLGLWGCRVSGTSSCFVVPGYAFEGSILGLLHLFLPFFACAEKYPRNFKILAPDAGRTGRAGAGPPAF